MHLPLSLHIDLRLVQEVAQHHQPVDFEAKNQQRQKTPDLGKIWPGRGAMVEMGWGYDFHWAPS